MKQKLINKQAIVLVFIYLRMTVWSRRGEAGPHIKRRAVPGARGLRRRLFSNGFFLVPTKPGRSAWLFLIEGLHPMPAGDIGVSGRCCVPLQHPSVAGRAGLGCILEVPLGTLAPSPSSRAGIPTSLLPR